MSTAPEQLASETFIGSQLLQTHSIIKPFSAFDTASQDVSSVETKVVTINPIHDEPQSTCRAESVSNRLYRTQIRNNREGGLISLETHEDEFNATQVNPRVATSPPQVKVGWPTLSFK